MLGAALAWGMVWYIVWTILPVDGQPEWLYTLVDFFDSLGLHLSNIVTEQNYLLFILCLGVYIAGRINRLILRVIWRRTVQE
jgi:hypothetical protein